MSKSQIDGTFQEGVQFNVNELQAGKGSGIGLFIATSIVEQHEGSLSCSSPGIGKGSVFTLELPPYRLLTLTMDSESDHSVVTTENENLSADARKMEAPGC